MLALRLGLTREALMEQPLPQLPRCRRPRARLLELQMIPPPPTSLPRVHLDQLDLRQVPLALRDQMGDHLVQLRSRLVEEMIYVV